MRARWYHALFFWHTWGPWSKDSQDEVVSGEKRICKTCGVHQGRNYKLRLTVGEDL